MVPKRRQAMKIETRRGGEFVRVGASGERTVECTAGRIVHVRSRSGWSGG